MGYYWLDPDHRGHEQGIRPGQGTADRNHFRRRHAARAAVSQPEQSRYMFNIRASYADEAEPSSARSSRWA